MTRALVIGGGVAGPVVAMALQRAGIDAVVHESYPDPTGDIGAWLGVQTNGLDALRAIDADQPVLDVGFPTSSIRFLSGTGKELGALSTGAPAPGASGGRSLKRSDLYRVLHEEARRRGVDIRYRSRLVDARRTSRGVTATFADGTSDSADLLVGCDGTRSRVRSLLDPTSPPARYVPVLNIGGYSDHQVPGARVGELVLVFGRRAFAGWTAAPDGRTWWFANPPMRREPGPGEMAAVPDGRWRARLRELYRVDSSPVVAMVEATAGPLRAWTTYDLPSVPLWHDDRMVLVGDAAHATSPAAGQGASMALEDAVVLAQCLRDLPVPAAFTRYEALRRPRVERVVAAGARTSNEKAPGAVGRLARDLVMPLVLHRAARRSGSDQQWMHQHHIDWETSVVEGPAGIGTPC